VKEKVKCRHRQAYTDGEQQVQQKDNGYPGRGRLGRVSVVDEQSREHQRAGQQVGDPGEHGGHHQKLARKVHASDQRVGPENRFGRSQNGGGEEEPGQQSGEQEEIEGNAVARRLQQGREDERKDQKLRQRVDQEPAVAE
jgi:hypothetical protein